MSAMRLLLARVGAGKTTEVQNRLLELKRADPLAKVWVLLSTDRQIVDFRHRFMRHGQVFFNIEYFNFYSLYHHLLAAAGQSQRCLDDTARFGLIRALLADLYPDGGGIFGGIAQTSGFVRIVARFIYELKQNLVFPEAFKQAVRTPKEVELAYIYAEYQAALQRHDLVDREGEGWLALEQVVAAPEIVRGVALLIVDGYDQFNALQAALLTRLGASVGDSVVTLTTVPGREATIGSRFADALDRLQAAHSLYHQPLEIIPFVTSVDDRHRALRHLSAQLLRPHPVRIPVDGAVRWLEAPDPAREVGAVLRRVKRLLLDGCAPDDILIALRDWALYGGQMAAQGRSYGLPLALHLGEPLARNPAVVALLDLLRLHLGDFRRRDLLDVLRSPYFDVPGLGAARVDLLERISVEMRVGGGRRAWLDAVALAARPPEFDADDEASAFAFFQIDPDTADELTRALAAFFDAATPPPRGTAREYAAWLQNLIGHDIPDPDEESPTAELFYTLSMPARIRAGDGEALVARDLAAMHTFMRVLAGLISAQTLAASLDYAVASAWKTFFRDLTTTIDSTTVGRGASRDGRVLVTTVADARGLPHRHVFILGLSEGLFPQPAPEDPLLLDSERQRFHALGIHLQTQAERAGDDGLFYSLIGQAHDTLTLSRPHTKNGEAWVASHLWRAALAVFDDPAVERIRLGDVPADPATPHEAALAAADALSDGKTPGWVDPAYWARIQFARAVELRRASRAPHDHYSGRLRDPALLGWVAASLNVDRVWSASQLNDYGMCGFRYFAARLLRLEPLEEPEAGMDSLQLGTLFHEVLEATYRRLGGAIVPERLDEALAALGEIADDRMATAPARLRFRVSPQWAQEQRVLRRRLERLIRDDFSANGPIAKKFGAEPRAIFAQEARFDGIIIDLGGESVRVRGSIDRIDRQGDRAIVVDYKTGSAPIPKSETEQGRNFQMMIYLLAAAQLIDGETSPDAPRDVAGGVFLRIGGDSLGDLMATDAEIIEAGRVHVSRYLALARSGDFAAHASRIDEGKCARYCDFHQFCRVGSTHPRKP
ncbi:MAG: PD-(D/E)XK nuclease family protein [Anaerolineae bacterium]|nr:PD-(D/E)XK nuclease family protein [Anaerolineae bacterium]